MRNFIVVLWMLCSVTTAAGQVSIGIGLPDVNIGINVPVYPELVPVPGYPVYYAPQMNSNYFFYDGMYWVYQRDNWYASSWYNGPWGLVNPEVVPLFILRVPVRYYRQRPAYFQGWASDAPPRWGEHWGNSWEQQRNGWNTWDHGSVPAPAPLPVFQRQYSGSRYPRVEQQQALQNQNYHYQPHDAVVQQHYQAPPVQSVAAPAPPVRPGAPLARSNPQPVSPTAQPQTPPQRQAVAQPSKPPQQMAAQPQKPAQQQAVAQPPKPAQQQAVAQPPKPPQHMAAQPQKPAQQQVVAQPPKQPQAVAQHAPPPPKPQVQDKPPQRKAQEPVAQHQAPQPQQAAAQRQQAPKAEVQGKPPQAKGPEQEPGEGRR
jgi:hypothetical protein